ncbi:MAG: DNA mismatch endonuclease Vsr [Methylococcaceae bacterium]|nr:MAG: DNA mismatch endonuclease Vsr [Methylococcaceae bacterium]
MDNISPKKRSWQMSRVPTKDTKPELAIRRLLHSCGYRYMLHAKELPGKPDIVFKGKRKVIFVHGCFWHRHLGCRFTTMPKSHVEFWAGKFDKTMARDAKNVAALEAMGWGVLTIWTCELKDVEKLEAKLFRFLA